MGGERLEALLRAHHRRAVVNELVRDPDPEPKHDYERDRQSGAGNCVCGSPERHRRHPHDFMAADANPELCGCALPATARVHAPTDPSRRTP